MWSEKYPRIYRKSPPKFIDWENERLLKSTDLEHGREDELMYFVIPKEPLNDKIGDWCLSPMYHKKPRVCEEIIAI